MKKILIFSAMAAVSALSSFGAPCASGVTLQTLINNGACEVVNGTGSTWTISNFGVAVTPITTGFNDQLPTPSDLLVTWNSVAAGGGFGAGFAFNFFDAPGGINWFNTNGGAGGVPNQSVDWKPEYWVTGQGTDIVRITNSVDGEGGNGQVNIQKIINTQAGVNLTDAHVFYAGSPVTILTSDPAIRDITLSNFAIVDHIIVSATNLPQGGFLTSFTNSYLTAAQDTGIPEPMTFVLMGAGLVGVAILRRRG